MNSILKRTYILILAIVEGLKTKHGLHHFWADDLRLNCKSKKKEIEINIDTYCLCVNVKNIFCKHGPLKTIRNSTETI